MMTVQQRDLLVLLREFRGLRVRHVQRYLATKHGLSNRQIVALLRKLRAVGEIQFKGTFSENRIYSDVIHDDATMKSSDDVPHETSDDVPHKASNNVPHKASDDALHEPDFLHMYSETLVCLVGRTANKDVLKAFDIMFALTNGAVSEMFVTAKPLTTIFTTAEGEPFGIVIVCAGGEAVLCERLKTVSPHITLILVLSDASQHEHIRLPPQQRHYYAVENETISNDISKQAKNCSANNSNTYRFFTTTKNQTI